MLFRSVAENKKFKLQTEDIKIDDPQMTVLGAEIQKNYPEAKDGAYVSGCLNTVTSTDVVNNPLTGEDQTVYHVGWLYFNPRTGETTDKPLLKDGKAVTVADEYWEYDAVAVNPYFDMDYTHVNEGEVPTEKEPATLPPTDPNASNPSSSGGSSSGSNNSSSNTTGKGTGTVDTADTAVAAVIATVLAAALVVVYLARKRENG